MADADRDLRDLLADPRESLDLELKQWIDPGRPDGAAKIARACMALRNNNGGRLVIGFRDDGRPDAGNAPADVRAAFHPDVVQEIVSKYSAERFEVEVRFAEVGGQAYPVVVVPSGVRTPVAAKADLASPDGKPLVRDHAVYVRSLGSNNTVSTTEARRGDWENLIRVCFDNREADVGRFVRRHLAALNPESLAALVPALADLARRPTAAERVAEELGRGRAGFAAAADRRRVGIPTIGFREAVVLVDGEFPRASATDSFRAGLLARAPRHTGWPPWVSLSGARDDSFRPYVLDNGWEALIAALDSATAFLSPHLDFWRIDPRGVFYHLRGLEDDLAGGRGPPPRTQLDFLLQVSRPAEVISTGLAFGRALGCDPAKTALVFGFRWSGLAGRALTSWVEPGRMVHSVGAAQQDEITTSVTVPLETPPSGIAPHVENAVRDLFALFGGMEFGSRVIEDIVTQTVERRM